MESRSIWGNIDLKAAARAIESEIAEPSNPREIAFDSAGTTLAPVSGPQQQTVVNCLSASESQPNKSRYSDSGERAESVSERIPKSVVQSVAPVVSGRKKRRRRISPTSPDKVATIETFDELLILEADNLDLRRRLMARLQQENALLRSLLARFSIEQ